MTAFEVLLLFCVAPVGILGWAYIVSCGLDTYEKWQRGRVLRR